MGQGLRQSMRQQRVPARVRGQDEVAESTNAAPCWHCSGSRRCECALCAVPLEALATKLTFRKGPCKACLGSGRLCWPEVVQ